jgi:hypothetical protein
MAFVFRKLPVDSLRFNAQFSVQLCFETTEYGQDASFMLRVCHLAGISGHTALVLDLFYIPRHRGRFGWSAQGMKVGAGEEDPRARARVCETKPQIQSYNYLFKPFPTHRAHPASAAQLA